MKWISIWGKRAYSPFLMHLAISSTIDGLSKIYPKNKITAGGNYWENGSGGYFYAKDQLLKTVNALSKDSLRHPKILFGLLEGAFKRAKEMRKYSERFSDKEKILRQSTACLLDYIEITGEKMYGMYSYGTVSALMGYYQEGPLYQKMNDILRKKLKNNPEKFANYLVILTNPPKKLKNLEFEEAIVRLAQKAKNKGVKSKKELRNKFSNEIDAIRKKYEWLSFDLCNNVTWNLDHYATLIFNSLDIDLKKKIKWLRDYEVDSNREFDKLCGMLYMSKDDHKVFNAVRNIGYYKWAREHEFVEAWYRLKFVQDEFGKRIGLSSLESKYLLPKEYRKAFENPEKYKKIIKKRLKCMLMIIHPNEKVELFDGGDASGRVKKLSFWKEREALNLTELRGMPANSGKANGIVRIINKANELKKMKQGDILVSQSTNPELVSGMKKAAAIITDEGGITSHAAIVSRELKIPCVVGVKNATEILNDGDRVEVDANRGIIKILKK